ncbi:MAG: hypothetical protein K2L07_11400 [Lachnospiraceae bacterium]|nr:hypothetical protein [Lachnospiraceae bacterium]
MNNKIIKRTIKMSVLGMALALMMTATAFAASVKITADKSVKGNSSDGYYATGYIKCEPYHYANTRLLESATDKIVKESGRVYGYNKVTATTGTTKSYASKSKLYAAVYYGWQ